MTQAKPALPTVELIPLHGAIVTQQPMTLDVLVRITPPAVTLKADRVPLNLSLTIDRSGSMQGQKMHYAREAARFAVENLLPCDRIHSSLPHIGQPVGKHNHPVELGGVEVLAHLHTALDPTRVERGGTPRMDIAQLL